MSFVWFDTFFQANKSNSSHFFQRIRIPLYTFPWNHQLYFIPVFIYTFIKVKSNWGKNRDGYAIAKWFRPFSLLAAKTYKRPEAKVGPHRPLRSSTKYLTRNPKYSWIQPQFYSPFWRNKPRHALSLQTGSVGAPKGCFCLFPLCSERGDEKKR